MTMLALLNSFPNGNHCNRHSDGQGQHGRIRLDARQSSRLKFSTQNPQPLSDRGCGPRLVSIIRSPPLQAELP
jgi:hypothetical protein